MIKDLVTELGIEGGEQKDGVFVYEIADSDEYSLFYNQLNKSKLVKIAKGNVMVNGGACDLEYIGDDLRCHLIADFEKDNYKISIREESHE